MKTIAGSGVRQGQITCTQNSWVALAAVNNNRMFLHVQNVGAGTVYLYQGVTAPVAIDGTVAFRCLKPAGAGQAYCEWVSGESHAQFRGVIWALAIGAQSTAQVGEW